MSSAVNPELAVLDASVFISWIVAHDTKHRVTRVWFEAYVSSGRSVAGPTLLPVEIAGAVARQTNNSSLATKAVDILYRLPGLRLVFLDGEVTRVATELAAELRLRGADAVYAAVAHKLRSPLINWDKEMLKRCANTIETSTPAELIGRR